MGSETPGSACRKQGLPYVSLQFHLHKSAFPSSSFRPVRCFPADWFLPSVSQALADTDAHEGLGRVVNALEPVKEF
jgi:hypothetical protein